MTKLSRCHPYPSHTLVAKGSGEAWHETADTREPGPDDWDNELEPFLDDFVERAPPRKRLARTVVGASPGNQNFRHEQQKGVVQVTQAK